MKISKYLWIDEQVKWNSKTRRDLENKHYYKQRAYIICTSYINHWLFEIVEAHLISERYAECYVVGITHSKQRAIAHVVELIDQIYNRESQSYISFKT